MRDFPIFTTDTGVSSLILKETPYKKEAYIHIGDVQPEGFREHLAECVSFCRMAGAERVLATGHEELEAYPLEAALLEMRGTAWVEPEKLKNLFPVTEATVETWRQLHNEKLRDVSCSATLTEKDRGGILESPGAYFVHDNGELLGIGWLRDTELRTVASAKPGAGETVMHTLMSLVEGADMTLEVASTNEKAIRLYEKLGFLATGERQRWYRVF